MAEWHKNLKYLNIRLLNMPPIKPTASDASARTIKLPAIVKGVDPVKSALDND